MRQTMGEKKKRKQSEHFCFTIRFHNWTQKNNMLSHLELFYLCDSLIFHTNLTVVSSRIVHFLRPVFKALHEAERYNQIAPILALGEKKKKKEA